MFLAELMKELFSNLPNSYGLDNWDTDRFGSFKNPSGLEVISARSFVSILCRMDGLSWVYDLLEDDHSKTVLTKVMAYRILGHTKVKLPVNTPEYWREKEYVSGLVKREDVIQLSFLNWSLNYFELNAMGIPIKLYCTPNGILNVFCLRQYEYGERIKAQQGDYVIDAGGCWGDTALYFAHEVGEYGKVFTFEFVPSNLEVMHKNLHLNPALMSRIELLQRPLWDDSNRVLFCHDHGPGSQVSNQGLSESDFKKSTLSIDDFVREHKVPRVDLIKMDIEGAELPAIRGAVETLRKYRPRLAISVYHSLKDFVYIPEFLVSLGLNYRFYLDHFSIHREETILFAEADRH